MSDDIKKKLGIEETHQEMYDELFADMIARAVDNEPQMVASTYVALGLRLYRSAYFRSCKIRRSISNPKLANFESSVGSTSTTTFLACLANVSTGDPVDLVSSLEPKEIMRSEF